MSKNLYMMIGLPGTGKSTYINNHLKHKTDPETGATPFIYSTDDYITRCAEAEGKTYDEIFASCIKYATRFMNDMLTLKFAAGRDIIWDQTNLTAKKRKRIIDLAKANGYTVVGCYFKPTETWEADLASRPGKTIPAHIIESMKATMEEPKFHEGFDFIHFIEKD